MNKIVLCLLLIFCLGACKHHKKEEKPKPAAALKPVVAVKKVDLCENTYNKENTDPYNMMNYAQLRKSNFKLKAAILNDRDYALKDTPIACSNVPGYTCLQSDSLLAYYASKKSSTPATEAIILIPGGGVLPEDFFNGSDTYLNDSGTVMAKHGYDVYSPFVNHISYLQNAQRRLADIDGHSMQDLDTLRTVLVIQKIQAKYQKIHLAGTSYGGYLAVTAYRNLLESSPDIAKKVGVVFSIEGYLHPKSIIKIEEDNLFKWTYEMVFPGEPEVFYRKMIAKENVYLAYGHCGAKDWEIISRIPATPRNIIKFKGKHEFKADIMLKLLEANQAR